MLTQRIFFKKVRKQKRDYWMRYVERKEYQLDLYNLSTCLKLRFVSGSTKMYCCGLETKLCKSNSFKIKINFVSDC